MTSGPIRQDWIHGLWTQWMTEYSELLCTHLLNAYTQHFWNMKAKGLLGDQE